MKTNRIIALAAVLVMALASWARTTYVVWQEAPLAGSEKWIKSNYYIWENTYTQRGTDEALEFTPTGKGWIGGGYESAAPFDNSVLAPCDLVFDIRTTGDGELSVQLTSAGPKAAQSVKLSFPRDGEWHTVRLNVKKDFPKVYKAWSKGGNGYVFSIVGGAPSGHPVLLRDIRYIQAAQD